MCRNLNELLGCVCLCHVVYYTWTGRIVNGIMWICCRETTKKTVYKPVDNLWMCSVSLDVSRCVECVWVLFSLSCWLPTPENFTEYLRVPQHDFSAFQCVPMGSSTPQWLPSVWVSECLRVVLDAH